MYRVSRVALQLVQVRARVWAAACAACSAVRVLACCLLLWASSSAREVLGGQCFAQSRWPLMRRGLGASCRVPSRIAPAFRRLMVHLKLRMHLATTTCSSSVR